MAKKKCFYCDGEIDGSAWVNHKADEIYCSAECVANQQEYFEED